jgi:MFS family permease
MQSWYLLDESGGNSRPIGPFNIRELEQMVQAQTLTPQTKVALVGSSAWIFAGDDIALSILFRRPPSTPSMHAPPPTATPAAAHIPPTAPREAQFPSAAVEIEDFTFGAAFERAWKSFQSQWSAWIVLTLVIAGLSIALALPQWFFGFMGAVLENDGNKEAGLLASLTGGCIGLMLQIFIGLPLYAGIFYAAVQIHCGDAKLSNIFVGFRRYGTAVAAGLLFYVVAFAAALGAYLPAIVAGFIGGILASLVGANEETSVAIGLVFAVIVAIAAIIAFVGLVFMRVLFAPTIAIDPAFGYPGVLASFRMSWRLSAGLGFKMLGLSLVLALIAGASALLLCVGYVLIGIPLGSAGWGAMYLMIYRKHAPRISAAVS